MSSVCIGKRPGSCLMEPYELLRLQWEKHCRENLLLQQIYLVELATYREYLRSLNANY